MNNEQAQRIRGNVPLSSGDVTGRKYRAQQKAFEENRTAVTNSTEAFKCGSLEVLVIDGKKWAIPRAVFQWWYEGEEETRPDDDPDEIIDYTT
jgi:hypothetical protein